jgi:NAD(P)H-flavin reductase
MQGHASVPATERDGMRGAGIVFPFERRSPVRRDWGIVVQAQRAAHDIVRLRIATQGAPFMFAPGQYVEVAFEGWPARPYVLANRPGDPLLEVHVQRVPGGMVSEHVAGEVHEGARVQLGGPYGAGLLRKPAGEPMLMIAGGWGLAAIKSVLLSALADDGDTGPVHVYHGAGEARDLYDAHILANAGGEAVHYVPIVETPSLEVSCRHGRVHEALESDFRTLAGFKVYIAGPQALVQGCVATAMRLGAQPDDVHAATFETSGERRASMLERPARRGVFGAIFDRVD